MTERRRKRGIWLTKCGSDKVVRARRAQGLTQEELQEKIDFSSRSNFAKWLVGKRGIEQDRADAVFVALNLRMVQGLNADYYYSSDVTAPQLRLERLPDWLDGTLQFAMGRDTEIALLATRFGVGETGVSAQPQAIVGLGGIGKTTLALLYAEKYASYYTHRLFLNASSSAVLEEEYIALAEEIAIASESVKGALDKYKQAFESHELRFALVKAVLDWLKQTPGWLVILDNADCYDEPSEDVITDLMTQQALKRLLPSPSSQSHLLVTTRNTYFHPSIGIRTLLPLGCLTPADAQRFLVKRVFYSETDSEQISEVQQAAMVRLAHKLGYLPLALEHAAAYISRNLVQDYVTYEQLFDEMPLVQLESAGDDRTHYHSSIARTWQINFESIKQNASASAELSTLSAFLAPEAIPFEIIVSAARCQLPGLAALFGGPGAEAIFPLTASLIDRCHTVLRPLRDYALVKLDTEERTYDMHRMVQLAQREALGREEKHQWIMIAIETLDRVFPKMEGTSGIGNKKLTIFERLIPHVKALTKWVGEANIQSEAAFRLMRESAFYVTDLGSWREAEFFFLQALQIRRTAPLKEPNKIAQNLNDLAESYYWEARYDEAEPLFLEALQIRRDTLPEEHPDIADSMNNLAVCYSALKRYSEAASLAERALEIARRAVAEEDCLISSILSHLACLYGIQGRISEMELLLKESLRIVTISLPEGHRDIAQRKSNLGAFYYSLGRYSEAELLFKEVLESTKKMNDHGMGIVLNHLANICREQERYDEAESLYNQSLKLFMNRFGADHPSTRKVDADLQLCLQKRDRA